MRRALGGEVGDAQVLADVEEDARGAQARADRWPAAISVMAGAIAEHIERGDVGGQVGRNAAFAEPAAPRAPASALRRGGRTLVERRPSAQRARPVAGDRAGEVRERRAVAQEP